MDVNIIERAPVTVACLRYTGAYGAPLARFWAEEFRPWAAARGLLGHDMYGISLDDPRTTPAERCRYDAGVEVPADFSADGGASTVALAGGTYATLAFEGRSEEIGAAWNALMHTWLPNSGMQLDSRPCFEYYRARPAGQADSNGVFRCDICIAVMQVPTGG